MEKDNSTNNQIDDILNSLNGIKRAEAPAFFYTRLHAKLQHRHTSSMMVRILVFLAQPIFALASLLLFVVLNAYAITTTMYANKQKVETQENTSASIRSFAQEYDISISTLYNDSKNN